MSDIITEVEKYQKGWGGGLPETPCGNGSRLNKTVEQRAWIPKIINEYQIKTVADIGAGDLNWIKHTKLPNDIEYIPYDLVPRQPEVRYFDVIKMIPPKVDLIMCLWVLNHFPFNHARQAFENIKASGSKYLLITDRPIYYQDAPPEINNLICLDRLVLNKKHDSIRLVEL